VGDPSLKALAELCQALDSWVADSSGPGAAPTPQQLLAIKPAWQHVHISIQLLEEQLEQLTFPEHLGAADAAAKEVQLARDHAATAQSHLLLQVCPICRFMVHA
jgi:hypothetical protein